MRLNAGRRKRSVLCIFCHWRSSAAGGHWPVEWWQPGLLVLDRRQLSLAEGEWSRLLVGVYDAESQQRLPAFDPAGRPVGDAWPLN